MTRQLALPDIPAPEAPRRRAAHRFGPLAPRPLDEPLDPAAMALVQACAHCGCLKRYANTGARQGARVAWSIDRGETWVDRAPACFPKAK